MRARTFVTIGMTALLLLEGCATRPMGPMVSVMPGKGKTFEAFQQDQAVCGQYADQQTAGQAEVANQRAVGSALLGGILGAGLGAAVGGGRGAAIGAASGTVVGTGVGANQSSYSQWGIQRRYDDAYAQCMYAKGNQVPQVAAAPPGYYGPAPGYGPPPGYPPPAPYGYAPEP